MTYLTCPFNYITSNANFLLDFVFTIPVEPVCDYEQTKSRYEVSVDQPTKIDCHVLAEPGDDLHFEWKFNQTITDQRDGFTAITSHKLEQLKQFETNGSSSQLTFLAKSRRQVGQLLCLASNSLGRQEKACVIQIAASELPDPVFNCFFDGKSANSFSAHCQSPQPSAQSSRQTYLLELYSSEDPATTQAGPAETVTTAQPASHLKQQRQENRHEYTDSDIDTTLVDQTRFKVRQVNSETPSFELTDLKPETQYNVKIYVQNSKGRSAPAIYQASTLPANQVDGDKNFERASKVQFFNGANNRRQASELTLSKKVLNYIGVGDYVDYYQQKWPLIKVPTIMSIAMLSIIVLGFIAGRLCLRPTGRNRRRQSSETGRKRPHRSSVVAPVSETNGPSSDEQNYEFDAGVGSVIDKSNLAIYDKRLPSSDQTVQLKAASRDQLQLQANSLQLLHPVVGSGSDTSRETNTETTLVSSDAYRSQDQRDHRMTSSGSCHSFQTSRMTQLTNQQTSNPRHRGSFDISGSLARCCTAGADNNNPYGTHRRPQSVMNAPLTMQYQQLSSFHQQSPYLADNNQMTPPQASIASDRTLSPHDFTHNLTEPHHSHLYHHHQNQQRPASLVSQQECDGLYVISRADEVKFLAPSMEPRVTFWDDHNGNAGNSLSGGTQATSSSGDGTGVTVSGTNTNDQLDLSHGPFTIYLN